jgi:glucose/arabinose dehydrogenase
VKNHHLGLRKYLFPGLVCYALASPLAACSDDDGSEGPTAGGRAGTGGTASAGEATTGGMGGAVEGGNGGSAELVEGGGAGLAEAGSAGSGEGGHDSEPGDAGGEGGTPDVGGATGEGGSSEDRDVFRPELRPFSEELMKGLEVPEGFSLGVFASGIENARMLGVHGDHVFVTRPMLGDVLRLVDEDADGIAESNVAVATDLPMVHGIAFRGDTVFLATDKLVYRGSVTESGAFESLTVFAEDLPDGGQHPLRTLGVGSDGALFVSIGSDCNACAETNPEHATLLRISEDGATRAVYARGLRNTIGFGWHPATDELWGMDHGSDWLGNDSPPEELNRLEEGSNHGWPYCYGKKEIDPVIQDPPDRTKEEYCAETAPSVLEYQAHGAPIGLAFYTGDAFPEAYRNDAFIALHGSWNRFPPSGYGVARIHFEEGEPVGFEDFVTGFLIEDGAAQFGRPAGIAVASDGALLFSDDDNGVVYRVTYSE